ncbi:hypothetical protein AMJ49_03980 [Parcubacteria bacterium DG_74_2]|nr:MAG: hypothetical protein AMJ49_03980 [Parcubacteria bacterium DG_74_2]
MKKILSVLILATVLTILVAPVMVSADAEGPTECCELKRDFELGGTTYNEGNVVGPAGGNCDIAGGITDTTDNWGILCLLNTIYGVTNLIYIILIALSVIFVLFGGFTILTAGGNAENVGKGKDYITYAVVGLVIALLARAIPSIVMYML